MLGKRSIPRAKNAGSFEAIQTLMSATNSSKSRGWIHYQQGMEYAFHSLYSPTETPTNYHIHLILEHWLTATIISTMKPTITWMNWCPSKAWIDPKNQHLFDRVNGKLHQYRTFLEWTLTQNIFNIINITLFITILIRVSFFNDILLRRRVNVMVITPRPYFSVTSIFFVNYLQCYKARRVCFYSIATENLYHYPRPILSSLNINVTRKKYIL